MITLLHGDNESASRVYLSALKQEVSDTEIRIVDGRQIDEPSLIEAVESRSLFNESVLIVIEQLFGKLGKKQKIQERYAAILKESSKNADIILWEKREAGAVLLKLLGPTASVKLFNIPSVIFQFLDAFEPHSAPKLLGLFKQTVQTEAPELVHALLSRRLRQLLMVFDGTVPPGLQSWQVSRLTRQAKLFTMDKLLTMYQNLLDIEFSIKSGTSAFDMKQHIEQFIIYL